MASMTADTRVHVLWAAGYKPVFDLIHCMEFGLTCTPINTTVDVPPLTHLRTQVVRYIERAHLVLVVTDSLTAIWAEAAQTVCAEAGCNAPIHVLLTNAPSQVRAACVSIRALGALLNTEGPVGIDVEDVRMALTGGDSTRIATAKATGNTRAQDALNLALRDLGHAKPESSALDGLLVIFAGASDSLSLKEAGMAIKQLRPDLGPNVHFAYCLLHDDSLGAELHVKVFATNSCGQQSENQLREAP